MSGGAGDAGGVSYGSYQMTSQIKRSDGVVIVGGTVKNFVTWSGFKWTNEFLGLIPGTLLFTEKWKELVAIHGNSFIEIEHTHIKKTHFDIQISYIIEETGIDLRYHSHTLNDVVWSTSVQQGPRNDVIINSIQKMQRSAVQTKEYDEQLINTIYSERERTIEGGDKAGQLLHFSKNSLAVQKGVTQRFLSERIKARESLNNEKDY